MNLKNLVDTSNLDHWLLHNSKYTQEERELIVEAIYEYKKEMEALSSPAGKEKRMENKELQEVIDIVKKYLDARAYEYKDCLITPYQQRDLLAIGKLLNFAMKSLE